MNSSARLDKKSRIISLVIFSLINISVFLNIIGFMSYETLPSFIATLLRNAWAIYMFIALLTIGFGIFAGGNFASTRSGFFQGVFALTAGLWFGLGRIYVLYKIPVVPETLNLFVISTFTLLVFFILIQIDLIWREQIESYFTKAPKKKGRRVKSTSAKIDIDMPQQIQQPVSQRIQRQSQTQQPAQVQGQPHSQPSRPAQMQRQPNPQQTRPAQMQRPSNPQQTRPAQMQGQPHPQQTRPTQMQRQAQRLQSDRNHNPSHY